MIIIITMTMRIWGMSHLFVEMCTDNIIQGRSKVFTSQNTTSIIDVYFI